MIFMFISMVLVSILVLAFNIVAKNSKWEATMMSTFECGFSTYFNSRFSFSIHYFMIGLIFLFLDLELCYMMPFMNIDFSDLKLSYFLLIFITILILGVFMEWKEEKLEWKY